MCIDRHWKKLDLMRAAKKKATSLSYEAEIELVVKKFNKTNVTNKLHILK